MAQSCPINHLNPGLLSHLSLVVFLKHTETVAVRDIHGMILKTHLEHSGTPEMGSSTCETLRYSHCHYSRSKTNDSKLGILWNQLMSEPQLVDQMTFFSADAPTCQLELATLVQIQKKKSSRRATDLTCSNVQNQSTQVRATTVTTCHNPTFPYFSSPFLLLRCQFWWGFNPWFCWLLPSTHPPHPAMRLFSYMELITSKGLWNFNRLGGSSEKNTTQTWLWKLKSPGFVDDSHTLKCWEFPTSHGWNIKISGGDPRGSNLGLKIGPKSSIEPMKNQGIPMAINQGVPGLVMTNS